MNASIIGFDLGDSLSLWAKLRLRLICLAAGKSYSNLMTMKEYESMLISVGYAQEDIYLEDVSEHTFAGVTEFLRAKEAELNKYGMTMGRFKTPGKVSDWWAKSGAIKVRCFAAATSMIRFLDISRYDVTTRARQCGPLLHGPEFRTTSMSLLRIPNM